MCNDDHRRLLIRKTLNYLEHFPCKLRIERGCGLVKAEDIRL